MNSTLSTHCPLKHMHARGLPDPVCMATLDALIAARGKRAR